MKGGDCSFCKASTTSKRAKMEYLRRYVRSMVGGGSLWLVVLFGTGKNNLGSQKKSLKTKKKIRGKPRMGGGGGNPGEFNRKTKFIWSSACKGAG